MEFDAEGVEIEGLYSRVIEYQPLVLGIGGGFLNHDMSETRDIPNERDDDLSCLRLMEMFR